jgi:[lysine-biosynthesis-protein LysW]--L-2-aminoadipate ligase
MMESKKGLLVHEINNTTEFNSTAKVTGVDIPAMLIDYLIDVARK